MDFIKYLTKKQLRDLRAVRILSKYGHTFRLAADCPEGYSLFIEEIPGKPFNSYELKSGQKLYHKWN